MKKTLLLLALLASSPALAEPPKMFATQNFSVVITTGNTFQVVLASPAARVLRQSLSIENNNATDSCWITFGSKSGTLITAANATKANSILLLPGGSYTRYYPFIPSDEIEGTCATSSNTLYIDIQ